jgi:hypothetical protein
LKFEKGPDMKKIYFVIFAFSILLITACGGAGAAVQPGKLSGKQDTAMLEWAEYEGGLVNAFHVDLSDLIGATEYVMDLTIEADMQTLTGHQSVTYTNLEGVSLGDIYFRTYPVHAGGSMIVTNLTVNGEEVQTSLENEETSLRVSLIEPLQPGDTVVIEMDFIATVPTDMGGNYGLYVYTDEILALDKFYPTIPVYNHEGWNVEDPPINADLVFNDAAFFDVTVHVPEDLVLVASGTEADSQISKGTQTVRFLGGPQRDFYIAASARFTSDSRMVGDTLVTSYFPPEYEEMGKMVLDTAADALQIFSEQYGTYPYIELDMVSTPMNAGGMEYAGAAAMSLFLYDPEVSISGIPGKIFLESATAHEVAHQWFFNQVMNDQLDEPWLDEGFAQYLTYVYYLEKYGSEAAASYRDSWDKRWARLDFAEVPIGKPAGDYAREEYSPIIYGRAPIFIETLAAEMGAETFAEFMRAYVDMYRWETVTTDDFIRMAEESCACELDALFETWWQVD